MTDDGNRYFCRVSGVRLTAPGVSLAVDPANGVPEWSEPAAKHHEPTAHQPKAKKDER
jgi:hypothetical protein